MKFRPLHDRVLVRRVEAEAKTAGGIIIPDSAKEKPAEGEIVAVGSGARAENGTIARNSCFARQASIAASRPSPVHQNRAAAASAACTPGSITPRWCTGTVSPSTERSASTA